MDKIKAGYRRIAKHHVLMLFINGIVLNLIIETLGRHSLIDSVLYMVQHPLVFLCNTLLIFMVLSIALFFRRRRFVAVLLSLLWLALGITNGVILSNRMTPFNVKDMSNLSEGLSILTNYFSTKTLIIICAAIVALAFAIFMLYRILGPMEKKVDYRKSAITFVLIVLVTIGSISGGMRIGVLDTFFGNLAYAYRDNGVPYSFLITWLKTGIDKPKGYSEEMITGIFDKGELGDDGTYTPGEDADIDTSKAPNIIFLQMESFVDPKIVNDVEYSEDPIPYFRKLMKNNASGYITVPAVGAGTANVEFEAMTGISARFFGPGEYPHKSVLTEKTCESIPYDLKQVGYSTHAIHNHRGAFYNRNIVFKNLGFDTFTCLEYMNSVAKTPKNWAKDSILTGNIIDALESTKGKDYIYTISVQGHGKYPTEKVLEDPKIKVTNAPDEEKKWAYEYFANQMYEMDIFLKELTDTLEDYDENIVLIIYGDHLPALDMTEEELKTGDLYKTQYVIWSNYGLKIKGGDTSSYEIGSKILKRFGIDNGVINKYHQHHKGDKNYKANLEALSYDILYGKDYIYGGKNPYEPTDMRMGVKEIKIDEIVQIGDKYYIKGQNFTEFSKISLDGKVLKTVYLGPTILALNEEVDPDKVDKMKVSQVEKNKEILSTTE